MTDPATSDDVPTTLAQLRSFSQLAPPANPAPVGVGDLAEEFHEASKVRSTYPARSLGPAGELFMAEPDVAFRLGRKTLTHTGEAIVLPRPTELMVDLTDVISRRRSGLAADTSALTLSELGTILGLSAASSPATPGRRMYPSAGALYPLDVIACVSGVEGVLRGHYAYDPIEHCLLRRGDLSAADLHGLASLHNPIPAAEVTFAIAATFARNRVKYGLRGYRFTMLEAGHLAHAIIICGDRPRPHEPVMGWLCRLRGRCRA